MYKNEKGKNKDFQILFLKNKNPLYANDKKQKKKNKNLKYKNREWLKIKRQNKRLQKTGTLHIPSKTRRKVAQLY